MKMSTLWLALTVLLAASGTGPAQGDSIDVSGTWLADQARVRSSSCPAELTEVIDERIQSGALNCTFGIVQADSLVHVFERCPDESMDFVASIDAGGKLRYSASTVVTHDDCYLLFTDALSVELGRSPTTLTSKYLYQFHPSCGVHDCAIEVSRRLRRIGLAEHGPAQHLTRMVSGRANRSARSCGLRTFAPPARARGTQVNS